MTKQELRAELKRKQQINKHYQQTGSLSGLNITGDELAQIHQQMNSMTNRSWCALANSPLPFSPYHLWSLQQRIARA